MLKFIKTFQKDESGATAIEYGLIAAGVAVVLVGVTAALGTRLVAVFNSMIVALGGTAV